MNVSENVDEKEELTQSEQAFLMIMYGLLAYMMENHEALVVRSDTIEDLMLNSFQTGKYPVPIFQEMEDGYIKFGATLSEGEE